MVLERNKLLDELLVLNHRSGLAQPVVGTAASTFGSVIVLFKGVIRRTGGAMR